MTGEEKLRETAEKLKKEAADREELEKKTIAKVKNDLAAVRENPELMKMYQDNAQVGAANLMGELPLLKVYSVGKSKNNQLQDGNQPNDGWFYYKPTQQQFQTVECHVLTISKGFRADGMDDKKNVYNQIMAGVIVNDNDFRPFMLYLTGTKLSRMWEFGKAAGKYTHGKTIKIPMFALKVKLTTEKIDTSYNTAWVINFEIMKNPDNSPIIVTDTVFAQILCESVKKAEDTIDKLIEAKATDNEDQDAEDTANKKWNNEASVIPQSAKGVYPTEPATEAVEPSGQDVSPDDIPF